MFRLLNFVGGAFFFLFGINFIVARYKGSKDRPHDNSQVSYFLCAVIVIVKAAFLFGKMIWDLKGTMSKSLLPTFVVGSMTFLPLESRRKVLDELKNIRNINTELCERITKLEKEKKDLELKSTDMKMENKKLNDFNKLLETDKKKLEIEFRDIKRENEEFLKVNEEFLKVNEELQKVNEDSRRKLQIVTTEVENLKKVEEEAWEMKIEIKLLQNLRDHNFMEVKETFKTIGVMENKIKRYEIKLEGIEHAFVELKGIRDELKNDNLGFRRDVEEELTNMIRQPQ